MIEFTPHSKVERNTHTLLSLPQRQEFDPDLPDRWSKPKLKGKAEADSGISVVQYSGERPLITTLGLGYGRHHAITLTPDSIWLTIVRGLVDHIDQDPEGMRAHFVKHEGKKALEVDATGRIQKGSPDSDWSFTFDAFSEQLREHIGKKHNLIVSNFSTTTKIDRLSSEVTLMGAMKHYFSYKVSLCCGFPSIRLEGTPEDWENIASRVSALSELGLGWWTSHLGPVIDQFVKASKGSPELDFWRRAYVPDGRGSGPSPINGWLNTFFPYVDGSTTTKKNCYLNWEKQIGKSRGNEVADFPTSLVDVPVMLDDNGTKYDMLFYGGLVGASLEDGRVRPTSGWFIRDITGTVPAETKA